MTPHKPDIATPRARAQALFDAVLRTRADLPDGVRMHCAVAVSVLGEPFIDIAPARDAAGEAVFDLEPTGDRVEIALRAGLHELGRMPAEQFREVFRAAEAGHDALSALR